MKRGKKVLVILIAVIILLCLCLYAYIGYHRNKAFHSPIHKSATSLVRINIYDLYQSMLRDYFSIKQEDGASMIEGLEIPSDIFLYPVSGKQSTTLFTLINITDSKTFSNTIKKWQLKQSEHSLPPGISLLSNASGSLTVAYDSEHIALGFSKGKEDIADILLALLQEKDVVPVNESPFSGIRQQDGHIVWMSKNGSGVINFRKGHINAELSLLIPGLLGAEAATHQVPDKNAVLGMWLYAAAEQLGKGKAFTANNFDLAPDSFRRYHLKGFELAITKPVVQRDTVVTYEYNDDFEKVPSTTIQENSVPGLNAVIDCDATGLYAYLQRQGIINTDSNQVSKKIFPLYQVYAFPGEKYLALSTAKQPGEQREEETSADFFGLDINFAAMSKQPEFDFLKQYIERLDKLQARASKAKDGKIDLNAILWLNNKDINALWVLLENL